MFWFQISEHGLKHCIPKENVVVFIDRMKQTSDMAEAARFELGKVDVEVFYMAPVGTRDDREEKDMVVLDGQNKHFTWSPGRRLTLL